MRPRRMSTFLLCLVLFCTDLASPQTPDTEESLCSNSCNEDRPLCDCDPKCALFGECCGDSEHVDLSVSRPPMECGNIGQYRVYHISTCPTSQVSPPVSDIIRKQCSEGTPINNNPKGLRGLPHTNLDTQVTYKNHYCALCNGDSSVVPWRILLRYEDKTHLEEDFFQKNKLQFTKQQNRWGAWKWAEDRNQFLPIDIDLVPPSEGLPRMCNRRFEETSSCPPDWVSNDSQNVIAKCHAYRDTMNINSTNYRNKYCALCNGIDVDQLTCNLTMTESFPPSPNLPLEEEFVKSKIVEIPCKTEGEIFDHFSNACVPLYE